ncbi:uncharacterized protein LOC109084930 [Xyrichtys novacula]|uniref:Uncharacterized protein LOC109084930 n=1 Tax=Xyrichtys novacula TaxID=13765 RepID=A0AAV1G1G8_XYRNO|nr:uncharacterized protein LOC109084930 [Xyrichtys novacula]
MKNMLKTTWQHPRHWYWHLLDYVIVWQKDRWDVLTTRAMRGAECWTDHLMVRSKLLMNIQPCRPRTAQTKKLNCTALNSPTTKDNLRRLLAKNLDQIPEESTDWPALRHAIHSAASTALGHLRKRHQDWFDCNSAEIQLLLQTKHQAHKALLSCPGSSSLKATFAATRSATLCTLRTMEDAWWDANIVVIYKNKGDKAVCGNSHGISLLSIAGKVLSKIMLKRLVEHISEAALLETQCGFWKTRSTTDMVFVLRQLLEKSREQCKDLYIAFIDLSKAFDTVSRELLWKQLSKLGVPSKFLSVLQQLYDGMQARVFTGELQSEFFRVNVEVKQGCVLAPVLFNLLLFAITCLFHRALDHNDGVHLQYRLDGSLFNTRRLHADDCAVLAHSPESTQYALNTIMSQLTTQPASPHSFHINGVPLKTIDHFTYLGSTLSSHCSLDIDIHTRINKASSAFGRLRSWVFENHNLKVSTKVAVYNAVCVFTLLYGAETWTPYRSHISNLEAFHIRCLQKILGLSWVDRVPYTEILEKTNSSCIHLRWIGHTIRLPEHHLPRQILYGQRHDAKRAAGGQKRRYKDYTKELLKHTAINPMQLETLALDPIAWRDTCARAISRINDSNQQRRSERCAQRHQRTASIRPMSGIPCPICGRMCTSHIGLDSHIKWHQQQHR